MFTILSRIQSISKHPLATANGIKEKTYLLVQRFFSLQTKGHCFMFNQEMYRLTFKSSDLWAPGYIQ